MCQACIQIYTCKNASVNSISILWTLSYLYLHQPHVCNIECTNINMRSTTIIPGSLRIAHNKGEQAGTWILWKNNSFIRAVPLSHISTAAFQRDPHLEQLILRFTHLLSVKAETVVLNNRRTYCMSVWGQCLEMTSFRFHLHFRLALMSKSWPGEMSKQIYENQAADVESCVISLFSSVTDGGVYLLPSLAIGLYCTFMITIMFNFLVRIITSLTPVSWMSILIKHHWLL